jgi:hypothetical protein
MIDDDRGLVDMLSMALEAPSTTSTFAFRFVSSHEC